MIRDPPADPPPIAQADGPDAFLAEMEVLGESMSASDKQLLLDMARKLTHRVTGDESSESPGRL